MALSVVGAVLLAALMHASWNTLLKRASAGGGQGASVGAVGLSVCWAVCGWPLLLSLEPLARAAWPSLAASVAVHVVYFSLLDQAYRYGDLSVVYPIARGTPLLVVTIGATALGERPSLLGTSGVCAIAAGVLLQQRSGAPRRALALACAVALCTAGYTLIDAHGVRVSSQPVTYTVHLVAIQGSLFAALAFARGGRALAVEVWRSVLLALGTGVLSAVGYGVALWAMVAAPVASVAALRETAIVFAALLAWLTLGEPFDRRKVVSVVLIAFGAVCVRMG